MNEEAYVATTVTEPGANWIRRASWGAIFAGAFVSIVIQIMFTLLGAAIGFETLSSAQKSGAAQGLATGSGIWLLVTGLVSTWIGACVAGRLSGGPRRADGMVHGIVTWSVSIVAMFLFLATTAGAVLSGAGTLLGGALGFSAAAQVQPGQTTENPVAAATDSIKQMFSQQKGALSPTGRNENQQAPDKLTELAQNDPQLMTAVARMESAGGASQSSSDRQQVINLLTTKHSLSPQEAASLVDQWDQHFQQMRTKAERNVKQAGQAAAGVISNGALWGFIALLLGLLAAAWGGWAGTATLRETTVVVAPA